MSQVWDLIFTFPTRRTPLNNCFWNSFSGKDLVENKFAAFEKVKRQIVEKQFFSQFIGIVGQRVKNISVAVQDVREVHQKITFSNYFRPMCNLHSESAYFWKVFSAK